MSSPIPTTEPSLIPYSLDSIDLNVNHWQTYTGYQGGITSSAVHFSIKYPPNWNFTQSPLGAVYYPVGHAGGIYNSPRILLGTFGHGSAPQPFYPRSFPAGEAIYGWQVINNKVYGVANFTLNNKEYIFEVGMVPVKDASDADTFKKIFDLMLNTFIPLN